jgi:hypothetical protein
MWPRWVRALATIWVSVDSTKRGKFDVAWTLTILFFGPLLLPFYIASRPFMKDEKVINCYFWRFLKACQNLFLLILGLASSAVFIENITTPKSRELAEVKRAEIKAGSILGIIAMFLLIGVEKFSFDFIKEQIEKKFFS